MKKMLLALLLGVSSLSSFAAQASSVEIRPEFQGSYVPVGKDCSDGVDRVEVTPTQFIVGEKGWVDIHLNPATNEFESASCRTYGAEGMEEGSFTYEAKCSVSTGNNTDAMYMFTKTPAGLSVYVFADVDSVRVAYKACPAK